MEKTLEIQLAELREQIAKKIMSYHLIGDPVDFQHQQCASNECTHIWDAKIARGLQ